MGKINNISNVFMTTGCRRIIFWSFVVLGVMAAIASFKFNNYQGRPGINISAPMAPNVLTGEKPPTTITPSPQLVPPLDRALARVTKKPFGIKITPTTSPVQPERFSGYHAGADFEIFPEEQNKDVAVFAVCQGKLLVEKRASGYGGVIVQACIIDEQKVTVVYGHLRLSSVLAEIQQEIGAGDKLGVLGAGYTQETDGERKHLHLAIHKGETINIKGYAQNAAELEDWLDPMRYF